jgi:hypothetical protein
LGQNICAQCCGEKRVLEIPCPSDCSYLGAGIEHEWKRAYNSLFESIDERTRRSQLLAALENQLPLIKEIEYYLAEYAFQVRSLTDQDVLDTLSLLQENFQTESRGIIYEHRSSNPLIQSFARTLTGKIGELREAARKEMANIPVSAILSAVGFLVALVGHFRETSSDRRAYLKFAVRQFPDARSSASDRGDGPSEGIILASR